MALDQLFLLKPGFMDGDSGPFYCPSCATLEGLLSFYPALRSTLDVTVVDFPRPRAAVIAAVGAANQGLPVLVIAKDPAADAALAGLDVKEAAGRRFLQSVGDIGRYLARRYGIGEPH
jgi:uracil-DNA glycosylase